MTQETDQTVDRLTTAIREKNIHYEEVRRVDDEHIIVRGIPTDAYTTFSDLLHDQYETNWTVRHRAGSLERDARLPCVRRPRRHIEETTMSQTLETIERRINALGLTEPTIQPHGRVGQDNEIVVQLPGEGDPGGGQARDSGGRPTGIEARRGSANVSFRSGRARSQGRCLTAGNGTRARKQRVAHAYATEFRRSLVSAEPHRRP